MFIYQGSYIFTLIFNSFLDLQQNDLISYSSIFFINHVRGISTKTKLKYQINPWYITGLTDGDGCFSFSVTKTRSKKLNWDVQLNFSIAAADNPANLKMLKIINNYFDDLGLIFKVKNENTIYLKFNGISKCLKIREHFLKYPLLTYKLVYFKLWSAALDLIQTRKSINYSDWQTIILKIIGLKVHFKEGLSEYLIKMFPVFTSIEAPLYDPNLNLINFHWLCGFINADGSFSVSTRKVTKGSRLGERVDIEINIVQHEISLIVLLQIVKLLGFGSIKKKSDKDAYRLRITSLLNVNKFIKLLDESVFLGAKALDYADFKKGINLINKKEHLTSGGLKKIKEISSNMNSKRIKFN